MVLVNNQGLEERGTKMQNRLVVDTIDDGFPSIGKLVAAKKLALRHRVWFRALNRVERGVLDLTTRYVESIKSTKLAKVVTAILEKLKHATESIVDRLVRTVGFSLAQKVSAVAVGLGNRSATRWAVDAEFARYLAVTNLNNR
jgi:hypothetical protein